MSAEFWGALVGAAVGVVAGTLVQFLVQEIVDRGAEREQRAALRKEMECNLQLVDELQTEATRFRNAINGDAIGSYFGYLNFERGLFFQAQSLLARGLLYKWFKIEDLKALQLVSVKLSINSANFINNNITERREKAKNQEGYDKLEAVNFANFVDSQLSETRKLLQQFLTQI